jgi:hypothetical protein
MNTDRYQAKGYGPVQSPGMTGEEFKLTFTRIYFTKEKGFRAIYEDTLANSEHLITVDSKQPQDPKHLDYWLDNMGILKIYDGVQGQWFESSNQLIKDFVQSLMPEIINKHPMFEAWPKKSSIPQCAPEEANEKYQAFEEVADMQGRLDVIQAGQRKIDIADNVFKQAFDEPEVQDLLKQMFKNKISGVTGANTQEELANGLVNTLKN